MIMLKSGRRDCKVPNVNRYRPHSKYHLGDLLSPISPVCLFMSLPSQTAWGETEVAVITFHKGTFLWTDGGLGCNIAATRVLCVRYASLLQSTARKA